MNANALKKRGRGHAKPPSLLTLQTEKLLTTAQYLSFISDLNDVIIIELPNLKVLFTQPHFACVFSIAYCREKSQWLVLSQRAEGAPFIWSYHQTLDKAVEHLAYITKLPVNAAVINNALLEKLS